MARGKAKPISTQISELEEKKAGYQARIENYKSKINNLDKDIKNLIEKQKQKELEHLMDMIKASGKTPEEVLASLSE